MHNFNVGSRITGQSREKVIYGFSLKHLISINDIRNDIERGILPSEEIVDRDQLGLSGYSLGLGPDGLTAIAGIPIRTVETTYKDPVDGVNKRVWPKNKVVFVATSTTNGEAINLGRTQYCVSEESGGSPGLWTRRQTETQIPLNLSE